MINATTELVPPLRRRARDVSLRGSDIIVRTLESLEVAFVAGVPGGTIGPFNDSLLDSKTIRHILTRTEAEAVFIACGHSLVTRKVSVAYVTSGPGATNAVTGLAAAYADGLPVVLFVGEVSRGMQGKGALQDGSASSLNIVALLKHVTKAAFEATTGSSLDALVRRAFAIALSGRPGPVVVTLPMDVQLAMRFPASVSVDVSARFELPTEILAQVAKQLSTARRPVILAGAGVRAGDAAVKLRDLADHTGIPVMTTPKGKGVFPEDHPLALGVFGMGGHPSARNYLADGVDVLLAVGTSLGDVATDGFDPILAPSRSLIHVDVDSAIFSRHYAADVAVAADAKEFLTALRPLVRRSAPHAKHGVVRYELPQATEPGRVSAADFLTHLQRIVPKEAAYVIDSGEHFIFATHCLEIDTDDSFFAMTGLGAMGSSVGAAMGIHLANPSRTTVVICGDGGFQMMATEIADAVKENIPIVVCVFNDERLGMCEIGHRKVYGREHAFPTADIDIVSLAKALGADAHQIRSALDLDQLTHTLNTRLRPLVLDVRIDKNLRVPRRERMMSLAK